jgi:hypothetical protein
LAPVFESGGKKTFCGRTTGIGHANVNSAKSFGDSGNKLPNGCGIGDIESLGKNLDAALVANVSCRNFERFLIARAHCNPAAFSGEGLRRGASNALAGGCHQGNAIFQTKIHEAGIINAA